MLNKSLQESNDQHTTVQKNLSVHICYFVRIFSWFVFDHVAKLHTAKLVACESQFQVLLENF